MEKEICRIGEFHIYADKHQYILCDNPPKKSKDGKLSVGNSATYYSTLENCIAEMYERGTKDKLKGSGTLETALKRLKEYKAEFEELVRPLKELEGVANPHTRSVKARKQKRRPYIAPPTEKRSFIGNNVKIMEEDTKDEEKTDEDASDDAQDVPQGEESAGGNEDTDSEEEKLSDGEQSQRLNNHTFQNTQVLCERLKIEYNKNIENLAGNIAERVSILSDRVFRDAGSRMAGTGVRLLLAEGTPFSRLF